ncbi:hypothetical protein Tco_0888553 [Tanacetum coccineum]
MNAVQTSQLQTRFKRSIYSDTENRKKTAVKVKYMKEIEAWSSIFYDDGLSHAAVPRPNTTNSRTTKPDRGHAPDMPKMHVSISKAAPVAFPRTNADRGRILTSADTITRGPLPDKGPTPTTNSHKRNTRKP